MSLRRSMPPSAGILAQSQVDGAWSEAETCTTPSAHMDWLIVNGKCLGATVDDGMSDEQSFAWRSDHSIAIETSATSAEAIPGRWKTHFEEAA